MPRTSFETSQRRRPSSPVSAGARGSSHSRVSEAFRPTELQELLTVMRELTEGELDARVSTEPAIDRTGHPTMSPTGQSNTLHQMRVMLNALAQKLQDTVLRCAQQEATVRELEQAQRQLLRTAKLASLGELAAGVAHELNQPLQIVGLSVDEVRDALERMDRTTATEYLQTIEDQVARGAGVIDRLLALSRHDESARTRTKLNEVITEVVSIWGAPLAALGIDLSTDLAIGLGDVVGNAHELLQVITNLVVNARDAVKDQQTRRICLRTTAEPTHACIEIIDTGSGIAPDDLPRVFDPFFTTKGPGKGPSKDPGKGPSKGPCRGTGLGLSVSHGIIRRHGGTIEVFSELDQGTRVRIMLPFAEAL